MGNSHTSTVERHQSQRMLFKKQYNQLDSEILLPISFTVKIGMLEV